MLITPIEINWKEVHKVQWKQPEQKLLVVTVLHE